MSIDFDFDNVSSSRSGDTSSLLLFPMISSSVPYNAFGVGNSGFGGTVSGLESLRSSLPLL